MVLDSASTNTLMELHRILSSPILFALLLFIVMLTKSRNESKSRNSKLPPGPWKLPIIGNLHQLMGGLPHHKLRRLSNIHGPLMHLQLGEVSIVVISSPEMAVEVLKNHGATFASRPQIFASDIITYNSTDIIYSPYGAYWRELRKICTSELLSSWRVKSFRYAREEEVSDFINSISLTAGKPVNLTEKIYSLSGGIFSRVAFGKKYKAWSLFLSIMREASELSGGFDIHDFYPLVGLIRVITGIKRRLDDLHTRTDKIIDNIINEHKLQAKSIKTNSSESDNEDLIDVLLKYSDGAYTEFPLTTDNIKAVILDIFAAGSDTSSSTVEWAMAELVNNPSVMGKAQAEVRQVCSTRGKVDETDIHELHYLKLVVKEILRLHPAVPLIPRESREKCEINGYEIPQKTRVIVNAWALGRDPNYWNDPDTFKPERFQDCSRDYKGKSFEFIPFGAGRRICPGIAFGMANVELILAELLYHFDWKLPDGMKQEKLDMTPQYGVTVKRKQDLVLIPSMNPRSSMFRSK